MKILSVRSTLLRFSLPKNHLMTGTRARNGTPREEFSIVFIEKFEDETLGDTYYIPVELD